MLTVADLDTWLHDAAGPIALDPQIPVLPGSLVGTAGYPDKALFITGTGGPGLLLEGATDVQNFQFRWRGLQGDPASAYADAEVFAKTLDLQLVRLSCPLLIVDTKVLLVWRTGGPPAYLASTDRRAHFTASYLFETPTV